jgi:hypothetical protein
MCVMSTVLSLFLLPRSFHCMQGECGKNISTTASLRLTSFSSLDLALESWEAWELGACHFLMKTLSSFRWSWVSDELQNCCCWPIVHWNGTFPLRLFVADVRLFVRFLVAFYFLVFRSLLFSSALFEVLRCFFASFFWVFFPHSFFLDLRCCVGQDVCGFLSGGSEVSFSAMKIA